MSSHPYCLRSRLNTQSPSSRTTPLGSPTVPKIGIVSPRKARSEYSLQLQRVIGTTTSSPNGLACCSETKSYAYCAGAVAVFAQLSSDGTPTHRYYRARPTAPSINPPISHYESSPANSPSKRRASAFTPRHNSASADRDWSDDSASQTWTARERIKTVACVALSSDGRWLAVGETGYSPRVLLFSTAKGASNDVPVSIVTDHTYGLRCVGFSSDMKYLATLGDFKDGFLFLWSFNPRTGQLSLHSANKCTANICDMIWRGSSLVTVGTRCIRVWGGNGSFHQSSVRKPRYRPSEAQPSSPGPIPLTGRNVLLGSMVDCTFTCVVSVDESNVVVGTETGHICLVDVGQSVLELRVLKKLNLAISSIAFMRTQRRLVIGTSQGTQHEDFDVLSKTESISPLKQHKAPRLSIRRSLGLLHETEKSVIAIGALTDHTITLDNDGSLQIQSNDPEMNGTTPTFAAHKSVILGVQALPRSAGRGNFFTYSKNGEIRFWDDGMLLAQESLALESDAEDCDNELTRMRYAPSSDSFISADRFGVLKMIRNKDWEVQAAIRAHSAEITCIDILDSASLIATSSRDRTVQIFRNSGSAFVLLQTLDSHVGAVTQVLFAQEGGKLLSCSADRSLIICERVVREENDSKLEAFLTTKVLSLKSSPLSMTMISENILVVSTMDRCVTKADLSLGTLLESTKTGDPETNETVSLNSVIFSGGPDDAQKMLIGYCAMDKSIRIYSEKSVSLLVRESGHTEGVSDIALLEQSSHSMSSSGPVFVSTGLDGTIMIWKVLRTSALPSIPGILESVMGGFFGDESETAKQSPASLAPIRKVLSKVEIADLTRASGPISPSSTRSLSPVRLKRKTSRLALATSIEDVDEPPNGAIVAPRSARSPRTTVVDPRRSSSPPARKTLRTQRSRSDLGKLAARSPSPPPIPMPATPKARQQANNARLRRAPSVPADLRLHATIQDRKQSIAQASDFGSLAMATEQASRMLKIYKKKLVHSKETVDLDEIERQLSGLLKSVQERKDRPILAPRENETTGRKGHVKAATESDVDQLVILLEGSKLAESPKMIAEGVDLAASF